MNKEASRKFFLESVLKERAYLFGQTGQVIFTEHGKETVTADGKRACWTQISLRLIRAGAHHYRGKSTEDLRAIFADMKRRTLNKLRRFEEVLTGREKMDNSMRLNERDNLILDIIGRESLPPTLQAMIERGELPLMDDNSGAATSTTNFVQQPAEEESEEQQQLRMDRLKQEWEDFTRHQQENNQNLEMTSSAEAAAMNMTDHNFDGDGTPGLLLQQQLQRKTTTKRRRIDEPPEGHDDEDDGDFDGVEVEENEERIEEEQGGEADDKDDSKAIKKAKLRFYESQCQLVQEKIGLAKAQRMEADLHSELLRVQLEKEKEQQQKQEKMASSNRQQQSISNTEKSATDSDSAATLPKSMKIPAATSASITVAAAAPAALWMLDCGELVEQLMHTFLEQTNQRALSNSSIDFLNGLRAQRENIAKEANVETFLNKFDAFLEEQRNAVIAAESRRSKTAIAILAVGLQLATKREKLLAKHISSNSNDDNDKQTMSAG